MSVGGDVTWKNKKDGTGDEVRTRADRSSRDCREQLKSTALNHSATPVEMYNIEAEVPAIIIYAVSTFRDEAYTVVAVQM